MSETDRSGNHATEREQGLGGILGGLAELLNSVGDLAEKGEALRRSGDFETRSGKRGSFQVGFNIRTAERGSSDGARYTVEPFGHVRRDASTGRPELAEVREPATDVFEEEDHLLIVAELPGVALEDLSLRVDGGTLSLSAERGQQRFAKTLTLPSEAVGEPVVSSTNGVFEIRLNLSR
ncbi:MAG: Hsp20/alpha crystallin family protein [Phycisphaerales bacterium]